MSWQKGTCEAGLYLNVHEALFSQCPGVLLSWYLLASNTFVEELSSDQGLNITKTKIL